MRVGLEQSRLLPQRPLQLIRLLWLLPLILLRSHVVWMLAVQRVRIAYSTLLPGHRTASAQYSRLSCSQPHLPPQRLLVTPRLMFSSSSDHSDYSNDQLARRLHRILDESEGPPSSVDGRHRRVNDLYLPIYLHIRNLLHQQREHQTSAFASRPLLVGLSAPQGCGKTTLTDIIRRMFEMDGQGCLAISLDDFYLTGAEQDQLAQAHPSEPLLQYRGNAGTHDLELLTRTLHSLMGREGGGDAEAIRDVVRIPRYDKSLRSGRGDRAPVQEWTVVNRTVIDVVLFEGWMLGFTAASQQQQRRRQTVITSSGESANSLISTDPTLPLATENHRVDTTPIDSNHQRVAHIDRLLAAYRPLHCMFDAWIVLAVNDINIVYRWRLEAEQKMRAQGRPAMTDSQVADFVSRFMPAYEAYLPYLYAEGPQRRAPDIPYLQIAVGADRAPVGSKSPSSSSQTAAFRSHL